MGLMQWGITEGGCLTAILRYQTFYRWTKISQPIRQKQSLLQGNRRFNKYLIGMKKGLKRELSTLKNCHLQKAWPLRN